MVGHYALNVIELLLKIFMTKIYSDGYTIGQNPSPIGGGYVVMNEAKEVLTEKEIQKVGMTNNEIELLGVLCATEVAGISDEIITDSMNTYWWVMKRKCKARKDLKPIAEKAYKNICEKNLKLIQEGRETNLAGNYIEFVLQK